MAARLLQPRTELQEFVARILVHESRVTEIVAAPWLIVPDGDIKLIFPFRGDIVCTIGAAARRHSEARIIVAGMRTEPGTLAFPEGVDSIVVVIKPEAAHRLLEVPMHELSNSTVDGEALLGTTARRWQDAWMDLQSVEDRVAAIQAALLERLAEREHAEPLLESAVRRLRSRAGRIRIDELVRELGWSRRQVDRRFRERIGVGPKSLASVLRFHAVYKLVRQTPEGARYAPHIYDYYYDQAHFLKDFKRYAGSAPRGYFQRQDYGRLYIPN